MPFSGIVELRVRLFTGSLLFLTLSSGISFAQTSVHPADCSPGGGPWLGCPPALGFESGPSTASDAVSPDASTTNERWSTVATNAPPLPRFWMNSIFVANRNSMVIFAGRGNNPGPWYGDAWALDLESSRWAQLGLGGTSFPVGRDRSSAVYDSDKDRMVVYGGYKGDGTYPNDVWFLDFKSNMWTPASVSGMTPHYRNGHCSLYDSATHSLIVFGGYYYDQGWHNLFDLWALDLDTLQWTQLQPTGQPPLTVINLCAFDSANGIFYVYGGYDTTIRYYPEHLWRLEVGTLTWTDIVVPGTNPGPRDSFSLVYDDANARLILYGGQYYDGQYLYNYNDVWAVDVKSPAWTLIVPTGDVPRTLESHTAIYNGRSSMYSWGGLIDASPNPSNATFLMEWSNPDTAPYARANAASAVECDRPSGGAVTLDGSASSDSDSSPGTNDDIASYEWFENYGLPPQRTLGTGETLNVILPLGPHALTLKVTDRAGAASTAPITVTVADTILVLVCPSTSLTAECTGPIGAAMSLTATATDACSGSLTITNDHNFTGADASGTYPLGATQVTFTATDASGNRATCTSSVTVQDTTPPRISCSADVVAECPSQPQLGMATASDLCDPAPKVFDNAPGAFPLGVSNITWLATDASGNTSVCQQRAAIVDTTPPQVVVIATPTTLWPPNHRMVDVSADVTASDVCSMLTGQSPTITLVSATSSEPDDATGSGDGNTTGDIQDASIGTPDASVLLRAERSGDGPGRVYTLTYVARDASGNAASALGIVTVPHDEGTGPEPVMMSVEGDGTPGMAHLYWNAVSGAEKYDVIQGDLSQVSVANGEIRLGPVHVLASGQTEPSYSESPSGAIPIVGSAFFYLVQYREGQSASGWGTESSPWPAEPSSCDLGCPGEPVAPSVASITIKRK